MVSNDEGARKTREAHGPRERGIDRVLKLLAYLNKAGQPVRLADLPKAIDAPRSTIYDLVGILSDAGILETNGSDNRVYFGKLLYLYGTRYLQENDIIIRGREAVERLSKQTGETSELCVRHRNKQAIVHAAPGSRPLRISSEIGSQVPIPWTASGRLLLSHLPKEEIGRLLEEGDLTLPDGRSVDLEDFARECSEAKKKKLIVTTGLINSFTQCMAAPIWNSNGIVEATICFVLPIDVSEDHKTALGAELVRTAEGLSIGNNYLTAAQ
ncbi:IclR family transcriptional regulator (plasmid) [Rhizobium sp. CB3171]|uniref:IclR family transcriptional regulator n=1 Tax=Rhizobium sp. CB3171 TaxID=3039157 RepID=UPI0024B17231|nr:IclR family transcriptional regulator [Rhizobium sp. CB3171]WFU06137.1 IclR family transcriptional regulator [Rhizobium sp. CB3171]